MTVFVRAVFRPHVGREDDFVALVEELIELSRRDAGTFRYEWLRSAEPGEFVVLEEYHDSSAVVEHQMRCADALARMPEIADLIRVDMHGDLAPELLEWANRHKRAHAHLPLFPHAEN
jgi:quinol monooxygenase YgiN